MSSAAALTWFARHEIRLAWREWLAMMTAGRKGRKRAAIVGLIVFAAIMHLPAYAVIGRFADLQAPLDKSTLIVITATILLAWALMLSQAIESVTRVFYARADLDLIMSSPVKLANVFSVRIAAIALSVIAMALLLSTPFVDVLVIGGGLRWFAAYGVVVAIGLSAAAVAIAVTIVLFHLIGPSRTRLVAQILAAIVGAGFVIALQIAAILSYGTLSRFAVLTSDVAAGFAPDIESLVWWPARAALGDGEALLFLLAGGLLLLGAVMAIFSARFADTVVRVSVTASQVRRGNSVRTFRAGSRQQALRWKEFVLLRRDPWLVSQTLMQLLYLVPPALMLWRSFADSSAAIVLITPVIVMAAGQLAGGLAWLTISGEDAADLVATAPLPPSRVTRAKIEVVLISIGVIFAPLIVALIFASPVQAAVTASGVIIAAASATAIQLWFRVQARRSQFRRRQTSSRLATFAEAFSSIGWAATAALALSIPVAALVTGLMTASINSITAAANASGSSCGRLCPARGTTRWVRRSLNFAADAVPSVARATPSASPSNVIVGTGMTGSDASRRCSSAYCGSPSARPKRCR
jgi:ABC-2 type transport system permease protein